VESDELVLSTECLPDGGFLITARGYFDDPGGSELERVVERTIDSGERLIRIDLAEVVLFNCAGARHLVDLASAARHQGWTLTLVGVRPTLKCALDLAA
jgi:anti-anti-sigma regulatory factor